MNSFITSKDYSDKWIENFESGQDEYRIKYLNPFFKEQIDAVSPDANILDVGCGWGSLLQFVKKSQEYVGIDINSHFFDYIKKKFYRKNTILIEGSLPHNIDVSDKEFDLVFCSMVLHLTDYLLESIIVLLSKVKEDGRLVIIDFCDNAEELLEKEYVEVYERRNNYIRGVTVLLPTQIRVENQTYFYKEKDFEKIFNDKQLNFDKKYIGDIFVAYIF